MSCLVSTSDRFLLFANPGSCLPQPIHKRLNLEFVPFESSSKVLNLVSKFAGTDVLSAVAAFSTSVPANFETRFKTLLDDSKGTNSKLSLLWIGCGKQDPGFANNKNLSDVLTKHDIKNTFYAIDGRHTYTVWR